MEFTKGDLPYLYENQGEWTPLHNGVEQQVGWRYEIWPTSRISVQGDEQIILVERISRYQRYRYTGFVLTAQAIDEWQYLDHPDAPYEKVTLGYRGYWEGDVKREGQEVLQPEVAILLGFTPDFQNIPAYLETLSASALATLFADIQEKYKDDDFLAFHRPLPIESPKDAPEPMIDAQRRMRAQTGFRVTRGRAAVLEYLMSLTGIIANNGGWQLLPEEEKRRIQLGLR
ncbi:MAG: hypothetical protein K8I82_17040 [Anaerolineae bacterium]|nr:hypothetical protein [Anaerolineae bacterium]